LRAEAAVLAAAALLAACGQRMADQPRCEPLRPSRLFADGKCAREPVPGTVPRGAAAADALAPRDPTEDVPPMPVTPALLARGRERYDIHCAPCHDRLGTGGGMIVRRGYTRPTSYHDPRLRAAPLAHFVDVIANGWGAMPAYANQVGAADRWAIAVWIRVLQRSQHASLADVPPEVRARLLAEGADG
jgi:mono/diheme cytochrome c family protein